MIIIAEGIKDPCCQRALDEAFQLRHKVFVEELGWQGLKSENGRERDEFDTENTLYLLITDDRTEDVVGHVRFVPSTGPHMFQKHFRDLIEKSYPIRSSLWESSRICLRKDVRQSDASTAIICSTVDLCLRYGIRDIVKVMELRIEPLMRFCGWDMRRLGKPKSYDGGKPVCAFMTAMNPVVSFKTRQATAMLTVEAQRQKIDKRPDLESVQQAREIAKAA